MSTENQIKLNGRRILVLDDERPICTMVEKTLTAQGAVVRTAADGRAGLQLLMQEEFDLLVVDLRMKRMDGEAFLTEALKIWPWLQVIIMTGYADSRALVHVRRMGVTQVLEKPFTKQHLLESISKELSNASLPEANNQQLSLQKIENQLRVLRRLTEPAIEAATLTDALQKLTTGLSRTIASSIVGVLGVEENQYVALMTIQGVISPAFVKQVEENMISHYEALSGQEVRGAVRVEHQGEELQEGGADRAGSTFFVPIIIGGDVKGLLILANVEEDSYSATDISFIYSVANHLSAVFLAMDRMRRLAIHDPLTGLYNRLHIEAEFRAIWERCRRYHYSMAVLILDIDHFKTVNDEYGHLVGDQVLKEFADVLQGTARGSDIIGRFGGEEFVIILPHGENTDGIALGERLLHEIRNHTFCEDSHKLFLTVSIGLSIAKPDCSDVDDAQQLLGEADRAVYMAKRAGRNCLRVWQREAKESTQQDTGSNVEPNARLAASTRGSKAKVLVVDDDPAILKLLEKMLQREAYNVVTTTSGGVALEDIKNHHGTYDVVLADLQMPKISGIELIKKIHDIDDAVITIIITGHASLKNAVDSLRYGAYDFIQKPFMHKQLLAVVERAVNYGRALHENRQYQRHLSALVRQKSADLREALMQMRKSYEFTLEAFAGLLDAREKDVGQHSKRVRALTVVLAREMDIDGQALEDIAHGALLHDIGKIGIPDRILLKSGRLSPEEWGVMQRHCEIGYKILSSSTYLKNAAEIVYAHQEKYDGTGYPRGLKGEEICLGARIFAVIDAYDAMRSQRVYRKALSVEAALEQIENGQGGQFDPGVVTTFFKCAEQIETLFTSFTS
ncbi:MAG: diguanylate cyclase [Candidatus Pacebacteria bacterium]|nr:diguanylate cyclase [Candidatus Paceibacterota bacterium]